MTFISLCVLILQEQTTISLINGFFYKESNMRKYSSPIKCGFIINIKARTTPNHLTIKAIIAYIALKLSIYNNFNTIL